MILFIFEGDNREPRLQKRIYVEPLECVSVLNSFPIFIYEYMK